MIMEGNSKVQEDRFLVSKKRQRLGLKGTPLAGPRELDDPAQMCTSKGVPGHSEEIMHQ